MSEICPSDGESWKTTVPLCLAFFVVDLLKKHKEPFACIKILKVRPTPQVLRIIKQIK